jgi:hypothetical protein
MMELFNKILIDVLYIKIISVHQLLSYFYLKVTLW